MARGKITDEKTDRTVRRVYPKSMARKIGRIADDKKADDIVIIELKGLTFIADYFVICSAGSEVAVKALADEIESAMGGSGYKALHVEGSAKGHWIVLDFGVVIAHVFLDESRRFYDIEGLWADAPKLSVR